MADRVPPQDLDAERALLGAIMLNQNAIYDVADTVFPDSFYASKHRTIFDAMVALYGKGEPIDLVTLSAKLKEKKSLDAIGGASYISELASAAPSHTNAAFYAQVVQAKATLRSLISAAEHIGNLGFSEDRDIAQVMEEAQARVFGITNSASLRKFISMKESIKETWERLEKLQNEGGGLRGVPSGFRQIDNMLGGLQRSDLIILAARPSMGKTSLALDIARRAATIHKVSVGVFSLEMSSGQLTERMLSAQANVDAWKLRTGKRLTEQDYHNIQNAIASLDEAPIYIDDQSSSSVLQMRSTARRLKNERDLGLIVIDYLQLITTSGTKNYDSMVAQVTEISRALKGMARELNVPVLALSQLSRAVEQRGGKPRLSDLRESGSIEQDADVVLFIHREDKDKRYQESESNNNGFDDFSNASIPVEVIVAKHRNGPVGSVNLQFWQNQTRFDDVTNENFGGAEFQSTVVEGV
jgi:replicative DNA helicase